MKLTCFNLKKISGENIALPREEMFNYPEKILQFGTGMLLRGLPDYFIDKANRKGIFKGRIVLVESTTHVGTSEFDKQDGLYTICERGVQKGKNIEENIVSSSISRVLNANTDWKEILQCAHNPDMKVIISNTTEMGLQLVKDDDINHYPPASFPGKLLSFLYERFEAFGGTKESGMVIIPTELLPDNGKVLESIVIELAYLNSLDEDFIEWLENANHFCSSLVDRIVTGMPSPEEREQIYNDLGYRDELLTVTEVYRLWAIEGGEEIKEVLSFHKVDNGVKIESNIDIYRALKLRFLNATHTLVSGIAFLRDIETVKDSMDNEDMYAFLNDLMTTEINSSIPMEIDDRVKREFIQDVQDRFRNPHLHHHWKTIAQNYSQKMKLRFLPLLAHHYKKNETVPPLFAFGFAAWITYMKAVKNEDEKYYGQKNGAFYLIDDEKAVEHYYLWKNNNTEQVVQQVMNDNSFWQENLMSFPGFYESVLKNLNLITSVGMRKAVEQTIRSKQLI